MKDLLSFTLTVFGSAALIESGILWRTHHPIHADASPAAPLTTHCDPSNIPENSGCGPRLTQVYSLTLTNGTVCTWTDSPHVLHCDGPYPNSTKADR